MRPEILEEMRGLEKTHWWFHGRRQLLKEVQFRLGLENALILDAGSGTGFARRELDRAGTVVALDASPEAFGSESGGLDCVARVEESPFRNDQFDLILALDVLEHIADDRKALREMHRVCKPSGHLLVTAPAYPWLWSSHDEACGHRRRYSSRELICVLREAGFEICRSSHLVSSVFVPAAAVRLVRRVRRSAPSDTDLAPVPVFLNALLSSVMRFESRLIWRLPLPFGLTVMILARKPARDYTDARGHAEESA